MQSHHTTIQLTSYSISSPKIVWFSGNTLYLITLSNSNPTNYYKCTLRVDWYRLRWSRVLLSSPYIFWREFIGLVVNLPSCGNVWHWLYTSHWLESWKCGKVHTHLCLTHLCYQLYKLMTRIKDGLIGWKLFFHASDKGLILVLVKWDVQILSNYARDINLTFKKLDEVMYVNVCNSYIKE